MSISVGKHCIIMSRWMRFLSFYCFFTNCLQNPASRNSSLFMVGGKLKQSSEESQDSCDNCQCKPRSSRGGCWPRIWIWIHLTVCCACRGVTWVSEFRSGESSGVGDCWPWIWTVVVVVVWHGSVLQVSCSSRSSQAAPPAVGSRTTFLSLDLLPPPQVALHSVHSNQDPSSQSTKHALYTI